MHCANLHDDVSKLLQFSQGQMMQRLLKQNGSACPSAMFNVKVKVRQGTLIQLSECRVPRVRLAQGNYLVKPLQNSALVARRRFLPLSHIVVFCVIALGALHHTEDSRSSLNPTAGSLMAFSRNLSQGSIFKAPSTRLSKYSHRIAA